MGLRLIIFFWICIAAIQFLNFQFSHIRLISWLSNISLAIAASCLIFGVAVGLISIIRQRRTERSRLRNGDIKIVYGYGDQDVWFEKGMSEKEWLQTLRFVRRMQGFDEAAVPGSRQPVEQEDQSHLCAHDPQ